MHELCTACIFGWGGGATMNIPKLRINITKQALTYSLKAINSYTVSKDIVLGKQFICSC